MIKLGVADFVNKLKEAPVWGLTMEPYTGRIILFYRDKPHTKPKVYSSPGADDMSLIAYRNFLVAVKDAMNIPEVAKRRYF